MRAHSLEIEVDDEGTIIISQTRDYGWHGEDAYIVVHPDQVQMLIKWLQDKEPDG